MPCEGNLLGRSAPRCQRQSARTSGQQPTESCRRQARLTLSPCAGCTLYVSALVSATESWGDVKCKFCKVDDLASISISPTMPSVSRSRSPLMPVRRTRTQHRRIIASAASHLPWHAQANHTNQSLGKVLKAPQAFRSHVAMSPAHVAMSTHVLKAPQTFCSTHPFSRSQLADACARPFAERERERALQKGREAPHAQIGVEPQFGHAISASSAERTGAPAASVSSTAAAKAPSTVAATAATTAPVTRILMRANARPARPLSFASLASEGALRADVADQEVVNDASGADSSCRTPPARSASPRIGRDERARAGAKGGGPSGAQRNSASDARTLQTQRTMTRQWEQMLSDDSVDRFSSCICTQKRTHMHPNLQK
jgi:hypothetical protein